MDKLFSPWRSRYIDSFKTRSDIKTECIFCEARNNVSHDDEHLVFARRETCFGMMNLYPYNSAHVMIVPNKHSGDFTGLSEKELVGVMTLAQDTLKVITDLVNPAGFNLGMNLGRAAGAGFEDHLHLHIVPRWIGDTNFMPTIADVKVVSDDIARHVEELRRRLSVSR